MFLSFSSFTLFCSSMGSSPPPSWWALDFSLRFCYPSCPSLVLFSAAPLTAEMHDFSSWYHSASFAVYASQLPSLILFWMLASFVYYSHIFVSCLVGCLAVEVKVSLTNYALHYSAEALCSLCKGPSCFCRTFWGAQIGDTFHIFSWMLFHPIITWGSRISFSNSSW